MTLTMPTKGTKQWMALSAANCAAMRSSLKAAGVKTIAQKRRLFRVSASGRKVRSPDEVRISIWDRRADKMLRQISGTE